MSLNRLSQFRGQVQTKTLQVQREDAGTVRCYWPLDRSLGIAGTQPNGKTGLSSKPFGLRSAGRYPFHACNHRGTLPNMLRHVLALSALCVSLFAIEPNAATKRWWSHVVALSGDDLQGRDAASEGYKKAARYVVTQFEKAGLQPAGEHGYYQTVPLHELRFQPAQSQVELVRPERVTKLQWLRQIGITAREGLPASLEGPLVFMGEQGGDATGKVVVALNGHVPRKAPGAVALVTIDNPSAVEPPRWPIQYAVSMRLRETTPPGRGGPPTMRFNPAEAELLFATSGHTYRELYARHRSPALFPTERLAPGFPQLFERRCGVR
jgi:hypothetical protein